MHVRATDKATGKEQKIEIKAGSGLSDEEIERMVNDAEQHKDEDRKFQELVSARNSADGMVHATRSSITELGDELSADEKAPIEEAIVAVEEAMKGEDKAAIEASVEALTQVSQVLMQKAAAKAQGQAEAPTAEDVSEDGDNVVDAEFEEVKEDDK